MLFDDSLKFREGNGFFAHHREIDFVLAGVLGKALKQALKRLYVLTDILRPSPARTIRRNPYFPVSGIVDDIRYYLESVARRIWLVLPDHGILIS